MLVDAHRALLNIARSARPELASEARAHAARIEADPNFHRVRSRLT
jgi:hypothetical protein